MMQDETTTPAEDDRAIRQVTARFAEAIMRRDTATFRSLWTPDGRWRIGAPASLEATGQDDITAMLEQLWTGNDAFVHFAFPSVIQVDGSTARMTCLCQEAAKGPDGRFYRTSGMWTDLLRRTDSGWVFAERDYQYLWLDHSPFAGDMFPLAAAPQDSGR